MGVDVVVVSVPLYLRYRNCSVDRCRTNYAAHVLLQLCAIGGSVPNPVAVCIAMHGSCFFSFEKNNGVQYELDGIVHEHAETCSRRPPSA